MKTVIVITTITILSGAFLCVLLPLLLLLRFLLSHWATALQVHGVQENQRLHPASLEAAEPRSFCMVKGLGFRAREKPTLDQEALRECATCVSRRTNCFFFFFF